MNDGISLKKNQNVLTLHPLFKNWPDGVIAFDEQGNIIDVNQTGLELLGYKLEELENKNLHSVLCGQAADYQHRAENCPIVNIHNSIDLNEIIDAWFVQKNGIYLHVDVRYITTITDDKMYHLVTFQDCTARRYSEKELQRLALFAELNPSPIIEFNELGLIYFSNPAMVELIAELGFDSQGMPRVLPGDVQSIIENCLSSGETITDIEVQSCGRWFLWNFHPVLERSLVQGYGLEITNRKEAEELLFTEKERFFVTLESIEDVVITLDIHEKITFLNAKATELTGWKNAEAVGLPLKEVVKLYNTENKKMVNNLVRRTIDENRSHRVPDTLFLAHRDGYVINVKQVVSPMRNRHNEVMGAIVALQDVTDAKRMEQSLTYQATHDALTGLINRTEFENRLRQSIERSKTDKIIHALLYLDLDNFKIINDTCGHVAGDQLLCQITKILSDKFRRGDTVARLGGDEFGIILEGCTTDRATEIAINICQQIQQFIFIWESHRFSVGGSIGLVPITEDCSDVNQLLILADSSCYAAKDLGRNRVHVYQDNDADVMKKKGEMQWVSRINRALQEDRFVLFFQLIKPVNFVEDGLHFEILLRMEDEHGNLIPPGAFLPAAEHYDLIKILDHWVIRNTFNWLNDHPDITEQINLCSINLSGNSIGDEHFMHHLADHFKHCNFSPKKICFEVTETAAIQNLSVASLFIDTIKKLGCSFSLDDFGSGMSSFGYLKQLNIDYLKIDGLFVKDIVIDPVDSAMVRSINEVGQIMGLRTIAEYVENEDVLNAIKEIGVDFAQGYGISRPMPLDDIFTLLE